MPERTRLQVLGTLLLSQGRRQVTLVDIGRPKVAALLVYLAVQPGLRASRESVYATLWPGKAPAAAANNLYKCGHHQRKVLRAARMRDVVRLERGAVALSSSVEVDYAEFVHVAADATDARACERAVALHGTVALSQTCAWARVVAEREATLYRDACVALSGHRVAMGDVRRGVALLESVVADDPMREDAWMSLLRLDVQTRGADGLRARLANMEAALAAHGRPLPAPALAMRDSATRAGAPLGGAPPVVLPAAGDAPADAGGDPAGVFVGRVRELQDLRDALALAAGGRGQVCVLAGEPGIGKTRLAEQLASLAAPAGFEVVWGRCLEGGIAPVYWPWVQVLRDVLSRPGGREVLQEHRAASDVVALLIPETGLGSAPLPALEPEMARFRLYDAVAVLLRALSARWPLVVVIDDAHDADEPSLRLLSFLSRELARSPLLFAVTYRDTEVGVEHPLTHALAELARSKGHARRTLTGLDEEEVRELARVTAGVEPSDGFISALCERTGGNPLYIREMLRLFGAEGGTTPERADAAALPFPDSARDIISERLQRLSPACVGVLTVGSILGRTFDVVTVSLMMERTVAEVVAALDEAVEARVVVRANAASFTFSHMLLAEALYAATPGERRVTLYAKAAEAIESAWGPERPERAFELSHHYHRAALGGRDVERAVEAAERAADQAEAAFAHGRSIEELRRALELLALSQSRAPARRGALLLRLGAAQKADGDSAGARATFSEAASQARATGDHDLLAHAALEYEGVGVTTGAVAATLVGLLREALDRPPADDSALRARLLARLAMALYWSDAVDVRDASSIEALEIARRTGDPGALAHALRARHFTLGMERPEERLGLSTEILRLAREAGDGDMEFGARGTHLMDFLELGDIEGVGAQMQHISRLAAELQQPIHIWAKDARRAMRLMLAGRFEEGEQAARDAVGVGLRSRDPNVLPYFGVHMVTVCGETGRMGEIEGAISNFIDQYPAVLAWRTAAALLHMQAGDRDATVEEFERLAAGEFSGLTRDWTWLGAVAICARVCAYLGDARRAEALYALLAPYAGRTVVVAASIGCWGAVDRYLGILATILGRYEDAERHLEHALALNTRIGAHPYIAHTHHQQAWLLWRRGDPQDRPRVIELLDRAEASAARMKMRPLCEWIAELRPQV